MMRYWYDTEFIERGSQYPIDPISIGIIAEDGREYYAQVADVNPAHASQWVKDHVFPHLVECHNCDALALHSCSGACPWRTRWQIKREIVEFMDIEKYGKPELWAYYADYDHVVFCQLFGTMMELPNGFPMYTMDIKQFSMMLGDPRLPEQGKGEHNALADARWNKVAWEFLWKYYDEAEAARKREAMYAR